MTSALRTYNQAKDLKAVQRIWHEIGWIDPAEPNHQKGVAELFKSGHAEVATIDGNAECAVHWVPGTLRYLNATLPLGAVNAVTTSHIARKQGFARQLTARALAAQAKAGMAVSALGIFDQGFYDQLGYGTGPYVNEAQFDAATLRLPSAQHRPPKRLSVKDAAAMHKAMTARKQAHGGICLTPPETIQAEALYQKKPFGLGYFDGPSDELTHFIWGEMQGEEHGPYRITARAYQSSEQLLELLALMKSLSDQVSSFILQEFGDFQFQDLLAAPFRTARNLEGGDHAQRLTAYAAWQLRILDLPACLAACRTPAPLTFNLTLTDPLSQLLAAADGWQGLAGNYTVTLGPKSSVKPGHTKSLPLLQASVGAFSRMWLGVRPASHLAVSDDLQASEELLQQLDQTLRLPVPEFGWEF